MKTLTLATGLPVCLHQAKPERVRHNVRIILNHSGNQNPSAKLARRRMLLGVGLAASLASLKTRPAFADGLESIDLPDVQAPDMFVKRQASIKAKDAARDAEFESSEYLQELLAKTEANKKQRKIELQNKYCMRGAQYGFGDCAGFKFDKEGNIIIE